MARGNSLYAKLTRDLIPQYCKRIISDDETIQMLLSMLYQHTGIDYGNKTKAYSEGYETGRVETRRAYEGKRYTEAEMDKHGQYKYREGFEDGKQSAWDLQQRELDERYEAGLKAGTESEKQRHSTEILNLHYKHELALDIKWKEGYQVGKNEKAQAYHDGYSEGKQAGLKQSAAQYMQGVEDGRVHGSTESARNKQAVDIRQAHDKGFADGYAKGKEEGAKGKEKFATDRAEEAYSRGYRIGLGNGIKQGKKEVVDFINNMKVSQ